MYLLDDFIDYIISLGLATESDVDIFSNYSPDSPDDCICVYEYNGSEPSKWAPVGVRSFQIVCRGKQRATAKQQCWDIYNMLLPFNSNIIHVSDIDGILALRNSPILIDIDDKHRALYAFNLAITIQY